MSSQRYTGMIHACESVCGREEWGWGWVCLAVSVPMCIFVYVSRMTACARRFTLPLKTKIKSEVLLLLLLIITLITFKGAVQDFLQCLHCAANRVQHICSSGLGKIVCKSCATHQMLITCNMLCYVLSGTKGQLSY